jgi:hypothetical protein
MLLCRLHGSLAKQQLNLLQFAARHNFAQVTFSLNAVSPAAGPRPLSQFANHLQIRIDKAKTLAIICCSEATIFANQWQLATDFD